MIKCSDCNAKDGCWVVEDHDTYTVDKYGYVKGESDMMQEIYQRGPIGCSVVSNPTFKNYSSGIYEDKEGYN